MLKKIVFIPLLLLSLGGIAQVVPQPLDSLNLDADSLMMKARPVNADTLAYAETYKREAFQFSWGIRGAIAQGRLNTAEDKVVRINPTGTPLLVNNKIVRDQLVSNTSLVTGFNGAVFVRLIRGSFYLQPEVIYAQKGGKFDFLLSDGTLANRVEASFNTIDIPLLIGIRFRNARIFAGPMASYALNMNDKFINSLSPYTNEALSSDFFKKPILNGIVGLGFEFGSFFFDVRYESGLGRYVDRTIGPGSNSSPFFFTADQLMLSIGLIR
jgi:hypothetical protein